MNSENWIHRDKLAKIESEELQQAAYIFQRRMRAESKSSAGRERSHDSHHSGAPSVSSPNAEHSEPWPQLQEASQRGQGGQDGFCERSVCGGRPSLGGRPVVSNWTHRVADISYARGSSPKTEQARGGLGVDTHPSPRPTPPHSCTRRSQFPGRSAPPTSWTRSPWQASLAPAPSARPAPPCTPTAS